MHVVERDPTRIGDAYLVGRNAADPAISGPGELLIDQLLLRRFAR
jgi:hypothetical protein